MIVLYILGVVVSAIVLYLCIIIFAPIMAVEKQPIEITETKGEIPDNREEVSFDVEGSMLSGWFYKDGKDCKGPCIIMSHGFSGTKDMELEKYALKFSDAGYSVLLYDYRYYGESEGEPRQLYCGPYQIEDLKGAISYARSRNEVDEEQIVLWGTSAGANYGIVIAGQDERIAAVIGQCGAFDHKADSKLYLDDVGMGYFLKLFVHGQRDKGRSRFGLSPHKYPAYGRPGSIAMLARDGAMEGVARLAKNSTTFVNETCARLALMPHAKDPLESAENVNCPVLILVCERDTLVSPESHKRLVEILGQKVEVISFPIGHFDIYFDAWYEKASDDVIDFLNKAVKKLSLS